MSERKMVKVCEADKRLNHGLRKLTQGVNDGYKERLKTKPKTRSSQRSTSLNVNKYHYPKETAEINSVKCLRIF